MKKIERITVYSLLGLLFILALFFDLPLSSTLYSPSHLFGQIGEMGAEIPAYLLLVFASACLYRFYPRFKSKAWNFALSFVFIVLTIGIALYGGNHFLHLLNRVTKRVGEAAFPFYFAFVYGLAFLCLGAPWAFLLPKEKSGEIFAVALAIIAVYASLLPTMQGLKLLWLRPRYRTLAALYGQEEAASHWKAVWQIQGWWNFSSYSPEVLGAGRVSSAMASLGIESWGKEEFFSFPSGHTMNFIGAMTLCLSSSFLPKWKGKELWIRMGFYVIGVLVGFSRIVRGAHNATDVLAGFFLGVLAYDVISSKFYPWLRSVFAAKEK